MPEQNQYSIIRKIKILSRRQNQGEEEYNKKDER